MLIQRLSGRRVEGTREAVEQGVFEELRRALRGVLGGLRVFLVCRKSALMSAIRVREA